MLLGTWLVSLDEQGRLTIPVPIRPVFNAGVVVTRGFERCLQLCPEPFWRGLAQRVSNLTLSGADERWLRRLLFADASALSLNEQAMIVISAPLRAYAGLDRTAVLVGMDQYLEVWTPERWQECESTITASAGRWSRYDWDVAVVRNSAFSL
ncbi:MAG: division/cell wall cluster transcriptional repressor MraZ [Chloroflexus sp.]